MTEGTLVVVRSSQYCTKDLETPRAPTLSNADFLGDEVGRVGALTDSSPRTIIFSSTFLRPDMAAGAWSRVASAPAPPARAGGHPPKRSNTALSQVLLLDLH